METLSSPARKSNIPAPGIVHLNENNSNEKEAKSSSSTTPPRQARASLLLAPSSGTKAAIDPPFDAPPPPPLSAPHRKRTGKSPSDGKKILRSSQSASPNRLHKKVCKTPKKSEGKLLLPPTSERRRDSTDDRTVKIDNSLVKQQQPQPPSCARESPSGARKQIPDGATDVSRRRKSSPFLSNRSGAKCPSLLSLSLSASSSREANHEHDEAVKGECVICNAFQQELCTTMKVHFIKPLLIPLQFFIYTHIHSFKSRFDSMRPNQTGPRHILGTKSVDHRSPRHPRHPTNRPSQQRRQRLPVR